MDKESLMLTIAVLGGTGKEGKGLAYRWAKAGYRVLIGSRVSERAVTVASEIMQLLEGICTLLTLGGTSGTVTSMSSLPLSASFTLSSVARWAAYGTANTTISDCCAASRLVAPTTDDAPSNNCMISDATVTALSETREPINTR